MKLIINGEVETDILRIIVNMKEVLKQTKPFLLERIPIDAWDIEVETVPVEEEVVRKIKNCWKKKSRFFFEIVDGQNTVKSGEGTISQWCLIPLNEEFEKIRLTIST